MLSTGCEEIFTDFLRSRAAKIFRLENNPNKVLSSYGEENGRLEEFRSHHKNEVIQQLFEGREGFNEGFFDPDFTFNHNFLNNWVDLTKKISRSHNEPVKMSLEEEYMSRAARGTSRGGASGRDMFGSDGTKRGGPSLFGDSGLSRASRSGGGCGSAPKSTKEPSKGSNFIHAPDQPADFIFSSLVLNNVISKSVPELSIFQTPKYKFESERQGKYKYKHGFFRQGFKLMLLRLPLIQSKSLPPEKQPIRSFDSELKSINLKSFLSNRDLRHMMKSLGQDMTRLNIILREENGVIDFSERSIKKTNDVYFDLRKGF